MKLFLSLFYILLIISFYISPGKPIRTDHLVLYMAFIYLLYKFNYRVGIDIYLKQILLMFSLLIFAGLLGNIFHQNISGNNALKIIAGIENYTSSIAIVYILGVLFWYLHFKKIGTDKFIINLFKINVYLTALNVFIQLYFLYSGCNHLLLMISGALSCGSGAADIALIGGRTGGIFNQIIEGGFAVSIGLISLIYLALFTKFKNYYALLLCLMLLSCYLVGSKLSYLIGLPIFIVMLFYFRLINVFFNKNTALIYALFILFTSLLFSNWSGFIPIERGIIYITRLGIPIDNLINGLYINNQAPKNTLSTFAQIYTSGRLGDESNLFSDASIFNFRTSITEKFLGNGFNHYMPSDNIILEIYREGGYLSILFYLILNIILLGMTMAIFKMKSTKLFILSLSIFLISLFGSIGSPLLTANRVSYMFFATFIALYFISKYDYDNA